jgi:hypothetical protein
MMATNAVQRLQATIATTKKSKTKQKVKATMTTAAQKVCAVELPKFRYIDDVSRFLDTMREELDELDQVVKIQQEALAYLTKPKDFIRAALVKAAGFSMNITQPEGGSKSHLKRKIDPDLPKFVIPNITKLREQYALTEELYEKHRLLQAVETQVAMQFPDRSGKEYNNAIGAIKALKDKVGGQLKEVLGFLNKVAAEHVPKTFMKYREAVMQEISEHVFFEDSEQFMYVNTSPDKDLVFTNYILLQNATNDEGKVTPHLYISIQWTVTKSVVVQVNHEFELPAQLMKEGGTDVASAGEAVKAISRLLDLEEFSTSLGALPLATQLRMEPSQITPTMFTYKDFISRIDVDANTITFILRKGTTQEQVDEIKYPLYEEVKALFHRDLTKSRKAKLQVKPTKQKITFTLINVAERGEVTNHDAEFLADRFGLDDSRLRKVVNILNEGAGEGNAPKRSPSLPPGGASPTNTWDFKPGTRPTK